MLRGGAISSVELTREHLREIERLDSSLRAFAHFDSERALTAAREADRRVADDAVRIGRDQKDPRGHKAPLELRPPGSVRRLSINN